MAEALQPSERRRQQSRTEARRAILDATESLILSEGYAGFSIRKLVGRCGYSAPSIYHHFGDKPGLIDALLEERLSRMVADLHEVSLTPDPVENMLALFRAFAEFGLRNPAHWHLLTVPRDDASEPPPSGEEARQILEQPIETLAAEGRLRFDDVETAKQSFWALLHGLISLQVSRTDVEWVPDLTENAMQAMVRGALRPAPLPTPSGNTAPASDVLEREK